MASETEEAMMMSKMNISKFGWRTNHSQHLWKPRRVRHQRVLSASSARHQRVLSLPANAVARAEDAEGVLLGPGLLFAQVGLMRELGRLFHRARLLAWLNLLFLAESREHHACMHKGGGRGGGGRGR